MKKVQNFHMKLSSIKFLINLLFLFISIFLYINAPSVYSYSYCVLLFLLFIIFNIVGGWTGLFKEKASFEFFFMISFFMTNFIYPVFYFQENPNVGFFFYSFDRNIITKSTALALMAYSCYMLTVINYSQNKFLDLSRAEVSKNVYVCFLFFSIVGFIGFVLFGGLTYLNGIYGSQNVEWGTIGIYSYFLLLSSYCNTIILPFVWTQKNIIIKYSSFLIFLSIIIIFLSAGSRMLVVSMFLTLLISYNFFVRRIPLLTILILTFISSIFLYLISIFRLIDGEFNLDIATKELSSGSSIFDPFMDLIINNRNLYVLVDYVDSQSSFYFINYFAKVIEIIPFSGKFMDFLGIPEFMRSDFPTFLEFGKNNDGLGLGSNIVGEAYLAFGFYGVFFTFLLFGYSIKIIKKKAVNNNYFVVIFFIICSLSVLLSRIPPLISFKILFWPVLLLFIMNRFVATISKR